MLRAWSSSTSTLLCVCAVQPDVAAIAPKAANKRQRVNLRRAPYRAKAGPGIEFVDTPESWPDKFLSFTLCEISKRTKLLQKYSKLHQARIRKDRTLQTPRHNSIFERT